MRYRKEFVDELWFSEKYSSGAYARCRIVELLRKSKVGKHSALRDIIGTSHRIRSSG